MEPLFSETVLPIKQYEEKGSYERVRALGLQQQLIERRNKNYAEFARALKELQQRKDGALFLKGVQDQADLLQALQEQIKQITYALL